MSTTSNLVFKCLLIIAWIIFVGLSIEAGGLIVNFFFNIYKPEMIQNLYQKLDLSAMYQQSSSVFYSMYSFILVIAILKTVLFYTVVILVTKIDLAKPFSEFASKKILSISYYALSIGIVSYIAKQTAKNLSHKGFNIGNLNQFWADSEAFILMAAVLYIIAIIFKKGIELQNENDLTV